MIVINVDVMMAKRKMSVTELTERVGLTMANVSLIKNGKVKAIRISTLEKLCEALACQPGDILEYRPTGEMAAAPVYGGSSGEISTVQAHGFTPSSENGSYILDTLMPMILGGTWESGR
jgi:putative transcriptional regulator